MRFEFQNLSGEPTPHKRRRFGAGANNSGAGGTALPGGATLETEDGKALLTEDGKVIDLEQ